MQSLEQIDRHSSWENKTALLADKFAKFFAAYTRDTSIEINTRKYDETDIDISGVGLTAQMRNGFVLPDKVETFYRNGEIKQIKATYKVGNLTEVIISGKALQDFLSAQLDSNQRPIA